MLSAKQELQLLMGYVVARLLEQGAPEDEIRAGIEECLKACAVLKGGGTEAADLTHAFDAWTRKAELGAHAPPQAK